MRYVTENFDLFLKIFYFFQSNTVRNVNNTIFDFLPFLIFDLPFYIFSSTHSLIPVNAYHSPLHIEVTLPVTGSFLLSFNDIDSTNSVYSTISSIINECIPTFKSSRYESRFGYGFLRTQKKYPFQK